MIEIAQLPPEIRQESEDLLLELRASGWQISAAMYEASFFGDWFVDLELGTKSIRLIKENGVFTFQDLVAVETKTDAPTPFENFDAFHKAVADWAGNHGPSLIR
jgi:hypothetical protein